MPARRAPALLALAALALAVAALLRPIPAPPTTGPAPDDAPRPPEPLSAPVRTPPPPVSPPRLDPDPRPFGFCDPPEAPAPARGERFVPARDPRALAALREAAALELAGDRSAALAVVRAARATCPDEPALALRLGLLLADTPALDEAREALAVWLAQHPRDRRVWQRHARLGTQREIQAGHAWLEVRGVTVSYPPGALSRGRATDLAFDLRRALDEAAALTGTPARRELNVVVYADRSDLLAVSCVPAWTGGLYDGTLRLLAGHGAVSSEAARHESLHAQLAFQAGLRPRWFDEGLAQAFSDPGRRGLPPAWAPLARSGTFAPFSSLEGSFFAFEEGEDAALVYAQSEAMVRWLIATLGPGAMAEAVRYFEGGGRPAGLFAALDPSGRLTEARFLAWAREER